MHPSRTPHHAYQTPVRDPGGLFSFVLIFLSVPNFQWMKGYFRLAHMHSLIFSCLSLSPFDEVTRDIQGEIPWCMLFADDVVLVDESRAGVNRSCGDTR